MTIGGPAASAAVDFPAVGVLLAAKLVIPSHHLSNRRGRIAAPLCRMKLARIARHGGAGGASASCRAAGALFANASIYGIDDRPAMPLPMPWLQGGTPLTMGQGCAPGMRRCRSADRLATGADAAGGGCSRQADPTFESCCDGLACPIRDGCQKNARTLWTALSEPPRTRSPSGPDGPHPCPGSSGVEQWIENPRVGGSIPPPGTIQTLDIARYSFLSLSGFDSFLEWFDNL